MNNHQLNFTRARQVVEAWKHLNNHIDHVNLHAGKKPESYKLTPEEVEVFNDEFFDIIRRSAEFVDNKHLEKLATDFTLAPRQTKAPQVFECATTLRETLDAQNERLSLHGIVELVRGEMRMMQEEKRHWRELLANAYKMQRTSLWLSAGFFAITIVSATLWTATSGMSGLGTFFGGLGLLWSLIQHRNDMMNYQRLVETVEQESTDIERSIGHGEEILAITHQPNAHETSDLH